MRRPRRRKGASSAAKEAIRSPRSANREQRTERRCLQCRKPFLSEGPHNRLCDYCRKGSAHTEFRLCL